MCTPKFVLVLLSVNFVVLATTARAVDAPTPKTAAVQEASYSFKRGVNISHWLSQNFAARPYAAPWFGEEDVTWIAKQGFDHIRLPVDVRLCIDTEGHLQPSKVQPIVDAIRWARTRGLGVVLDAHFLPGADFNSVGGDSRVYTDEALQKKVADVWRELARNFASEGAWLRFEILNEPVAAENKQLNPFMHRMLAAIRESNPTRIVYVTSNRWSSFSAVPDVELPDDKNIALTIHYYEPIAFTHQRASWVGFSETLPAVTFPGKVPDLTGHTLKHYRHDLKTGDPLTEAQVQEAFAKVDAWVKQHRPNLEVYVGEFGVYRAADAASTKRWLHLVVGECEKRQWSWAVWDYKGGFAVRSQDGAGTPVLEGLLRK